MASNRRSTNFIINYFMNQTSMSGYDGLSDGRIGPVLKPSQLNLLHQLTEGNVVSSFYIPYFGGTYGSL